MLIGFIKPRLLPQHPGMHDSLIRERLRKLLAVLFVVLSLHTLAMVVVEGMRFEDALWLTLTSATTVGYGDYAATTLLGRLCTIVLLYVGGIALLAQAAALYFEYRQEIRNRFLRGEWVWNMDNHIVFLNCPGEASEDYFSRVIDQLRASHTAMAGKPIIIVSPNLPHGISDTLRNKNVFHVNKSTVDNEFLKYASVTRAHTLVVLASSHSDGTSDGVNFELVDRLRGLGIQSRIIVEIARDENRIRLKKVGADNILRPLRAYPELLARTIAAPGSEQVIETLFNSEGEECMRYDITLDMRWLDIINRLATNDVGLPIAYESQDGFIINNPSSHEIVHVKALFIIVRERQVMDGTYIHGLFSTTDAR